MSYLGRIVGVGATQDGNAVLLYGLSGRSQSSRARIAAVHGNRVAIEPYGEMTPEQIAEASRLVYDAIMTTGSKHWKDFTPFGVVSNGKQTGSIFRGYSGMNDANNTARNAVSRALRRWGHEGRVGDRYNTPRIAGMIDAWVYEASLGIVTAENEKSPSLATEFDITPGVMGYLSTYTGANTEPEAPVFSTVDEAVKTARIEGRTAKELAEEMYASIDHDFVVSSAAALWVPSEKRWKLAVKNKN